MKNQQFFKTSSLLLFILLFYVSCSEKQETKEIRLAKEKTAPFSAIQFKGNDIIVEIGNEWFTFLEMDSIKSDFLLEYSKAIYGYDYKKRFSEDFVAFLHQIDIHPEITERFVLMDDNKNIIRKELRFTKANREKAREYYDQNYKKILDFNLFLSKDQMEADLDELQDALTNNYSYSFLNKVDFEKEIQKLKDNLPDSARAKRFGIWLKPLLHQFGDAHSRVKGLALENHGLLPFETSAFEGKVVCHVDTQLLDVDYPFLKSINGIEVEKLKALNEYWLLSDASPQFVKRGMAKKLVYMGFLLECLGKHTSEIEVELTNETGKTVKKDLELVSLEEEKTAPTVFEHMRIDDNIGYIKIRSMENDLSKEVALAMNALANTEGMIIDVRDNGGGKRNLLLDLIPYFMSPEQPRVVGNMAFHRTNLQFTPTEGFLSDRFLYPITSTQFSEADKNFIIAFHSFMLSVQFDKRKYSSLHYLLLKADKSKPFYDKPVVVLMNAGCFSATDIFLSSFQQLNNVTLIGTKSGGGSGRTSTLQLSNSALKVKLSTMLSFQPNGSLYDRVGVVPDIEFGAATIDDVIGKSDNQLDIAIKHIHVINDKK